MKPHRKPQSAGRGLARNPLSTNKKFLVPENFTYPRECDMHDGLMVFASWLLKRTASIDVFRDGALIPISADTLRELLGNNYFELVCTAESVGLFERHHAYLAGSFPKSGRLSAQYRHGRTKPVVLKRARHRDRKIIHKELDPLRHWLFGNLSYFSVDDSYEPIDDWTSYSVDSIRGQDWSLCRDEFGHRIHTNFSRAHLSIRGAILCTHNSIGATHSTLVELDIRNCQPLLLGALALLWWQSTGSSCRTDLSTWIATCERGKLYEDLASKTNERRSRLGLSKGDVDREWVKEHLMTAHYGEQRSVDRSELAKVERQFYPSIYEYLCWLRSQPIEGDPPALWYRSTAMKAQRTESELVINTACGSLMRSLPSIPILTIHDAIVVDEMYADLVCNAIYEAFATLNVKPEVRRQRLSDIKPKPPLSDVERARRKTRAANKRHRMASIRRRPR